MSKMVLLLEDNDLVQKSMMRVLERRGHTVMPASTIATAEILLTRFVFDVIIADHRVPDGNGWSIATKSLSPRHTKVVFMSAFVPSPPPNYFCKGQDSIQRLYEMVEA